MINKLFPTLNHFNNFNTTNSILDINSLEMKSSYYFSHLIFELFLLILKTKHIRFFSRIDFLVIRDVIFSHRYFK